MNAKLFYLLQELKDNFSKELLNETYECFMNETHNFYFFSCNAGSYCVCRLLGTNGANSGIPHWEATMPAMV